MYHSMFSYITLIVFALVLGGGHGLMSQPRTFISDPAKFSISLPNGVDSLSRTPSTSISGDPELRIEVYTAYSGTGMLSITFNQFPQRLVGDKTIEQRLEDESRSLVKEVRGTITEIGRSDSSRTFLIVTGQESRRKSRRDITRQYLRIMIVISGRRTYEVRHTCFTRGTSNSEELRELFDSFRVLP